MRLIVNRYHRDVGLSREVIGTALHTEVFDSLPSDYESVQKSLMEGKPIPSTTAFGKVHPAATRRPAWAAAPEGMVKKPSSLGGLFGTVLQNLSKITRMNAVKRTKFHSCSFVFLCGLA